MKSCYNTKEVLKLLRTFKFNKFKLPDYQFDLEDYREFLNSIEVNPNILTRHCLKTDDPEKFNKIIYSILLYYKVNYEKEKVQEFLLKKELWKYFIDILPNNYEIFNNVEIPEELINQMIQQKDLTFKIINGTLFYLKTFEKILSLINENIDKIYEICLKEKKEININDLTDPRAEDNLEKILEEIQKIINYETNKSKFVIFDEEIFKNNLHFYFKKDLKKLLLIKKIILCCKKIDKELDLDYNSFIHETGIEMIKEGKLKNLELLDFIENEDIFFIEDKRDYKNLIYRPICVFDGFDLENMDEKFFEKWNKVNLFKKYPYTGGKMYAEKYIIDKINDMKYLGKLLKLFKFDNEQLCEMNSINLIISKYQSILKTYSKDTCPDFEKETSLIIYILDKKLSPQNAIYFMENILERNITSPEIINNIYLNILSNKEISKEIVEHIRNKNPSLLSNLKIIRNYELTIRQYHKSHNTGEDENEGLKDSIKNDFQKYFENTIKSNDKKKYKLKFSDIFFYLYKIQKINNEYKLNDDEYFNKVEKNYNKFKLLFEGKLDKNIDKNLYEEIYKIFKDLFETKLKNELNIIKEYYGLDSIDDLSLNKLKNEIMDYMKKDPMEILRIVKPDNEIEYLGTVEGTLRQWTAKPSDNYSMSILGKVKPDNEIEYTNELQINQIINKDNKSKEEMMKNKNVIYELFNQLNADRTELKENNLNNNIKNKNKELLKEIEEEKKTNQNLNIQINKLKDELIHEKYINKDLKNELNELKENILDLDSNKMKLKEELIIEKNNNQNLQQRINELSYSLNKGEENINLLLEKINSEIKSFKGISNDINQLKLKNEIDKKDKEINELKIKLARYPFELYEEEKIITVIFSSSDESIISPILCKNTNKFSEVIAKFYEKFPECKGDNYFKANNNIIEKNKNMIQNKIDDGTIIIIINYSTL